MVALIYDSGEGNLSNSRTPKWPSNPQGKLNIDDQLVFDSHRSGWGMALSALKSLHNRDGILFDGFLEETFGWNIEQNVNRAVLPYRQPWVGVLHNPPDMPPFAGSDMSPERILSSQFMRESMPYCRGIFVLSEHMKKWLASRVRVPICTLIHPTEMDINKFSYDGFLDNTDRKIIQIGYWLRQTYSIQHLPVTSMGKLWLTQEKFKQYQVAEKLYCGRYDEYGVDVIGSYKELDWVEHAEYDRLLSENIVFLHLYDACANNAVIECIVRETPLLVNPLPSVVEYLGSDYPLYFKDLDEAAFKAQDKSLIGEAHEYLHKLDKTRFTFDSFRQCIEQSKIYSDLPSAAPSPVVEIRPQISVDSRDDLNVVSGAPLDSAYVFVVCFRNIEDKIERCIRSILKQNTSYDYGVIVIDDASSDAGLDKAVKLLREQGVLHVAVANWERRYYTRNLYNTVNLLVNSPDTVIIEVDGDDYLEDIDILAILDEEYNKGALRTSGSFRCIGDDENIFPEDIASATAFDVRRPWDLDACSAWTHLKTFKKSLFMRVPHKYFLERDGGRWLLSAEDLSIHPKMIELAAYRSVFIDQVMYVFDITGNQHALKDQDNLQYIVEKLYRVPVGHYIGECYQSMRQALRLEQKDQLLSKTHTKRKLVS